jgi:hypothetical protein
MRRPGAFFMFIQSVLRTGILTTDRTAKVGDKVLD